MDQSDHFLFLL